MASAEAELQEQAEARGGEESQLYEQDKEQWQQQQQQQQQMRISVQLTPRAAECLAALNRMGGLQNEQDLTLLQDVDEAQFAERVRQLAAGQSDAQLGDADVAAVVSELSPIVKQLNAIAQGQHASQQQAQLSNGSGGGDGGGGGGDDDDEEEEEETGTENELASRAHGNGTITMSGSEKKKLSKEEQRKVNIRERMQSFRIRMLRIALRFGQNQRNSVVSQALHRMDMAEQMKLGGSVTGSTPSTAARGQAAQAALEDAQHLEELRHNGTPQQQEGSMLDVELTVLAIGKTGVGKSTTLNSLFGTNLHVDHFDRGTGKAQLVSGEAAGLRVTVIDTPGLSGSAESIRDNYKAIGQAKRLTWRKKPDIVLYFDRLDTPMRDASDLQLLRMVTDTFGASVWFTAIVVLTHASKAPPENAAGQQINYEQYTSQRSQMVQQVLRTAAGDMRLMNPVALAENHPQCRTNASGQQVLPNGQAWKPQLLLLCFASKLLSGANKSLNLQSSGKGKRQGQQQQQQKSPPLPFLLSSLIQSRQPHKEDNPAETEDDFEEVITAAQQAPEQERQEGVDVSGASEDDADEEAEAEKQETPARQVHIPAPDPALPPSFDADNLSHKYRFLESANQWVVRPVVEAHGWDHEAGVEGFKVEKSGNPYGVMPGAISGQLSKDKKDLSVQAEAEGTNHFDDDKVVVTSGMDVQNVSADTLAYTARSEARWRNLEFPETGGSNKTAAGGSLATVAGIPAAGVKVEDRLKPVSWAKVVGNSGVVVAKGDRAVGGNIEVTVKHSDDMSDPLCTTLNGSFMHWRGGGRGGDLALGANGSSQFDVPGGVQMTVSGNINSRGSGKISVKGSSNERLQLGLGGLVPVAAAVWSRARGGSSSE